MKFALLLSLFIAVQGSASNLSDCDFEAKITSVRNLARLDGVVTFKKSTPDHEQVLVVELTKITAAHAPSHYCPKESDSVELYVLPKQHGRYRVGDKLNLTYTNAMNSTGELVSWSVR